MRLLTLWTVTLCAAQNFDVATVKPHTGDITRVSVDINGPIVNATAMTARELITFAYDLVEYQVQGGDVWIAQTRWDVQASAGELNPTRPEARKMVQSLLADRFHLRVHRATQDLPVYLMTIAKNGPKLKPPSPLDTERNSFYADGASWKNAPLASLGNPYPLHLSRPLINRTGLTDRFDFDMKFKPNMAGAEGPDGESIFTAIEEQLGLHVEPAKAPIETIVIDEIQRPGDN